MNNEGYRDIHVTAGIGEIRRCSRPSPLHQRQFTYLTAQSIKNAGLGIRPGIQLPPIISYQNVLNPQFLPLQNKNNCGYHWLTSTLHERCAWLVPCDSQGDKCKKNQAHTFRLQSWVLKRLLLKMGDIMGFFPPLWGR